MACLNFSSVQGFFELRSSGPAEPRTQRDNFGIDFSHELKIHMLCEWAILQTRSHVRQITISCQDIIRKSSISDGLICSLRKDGLQLMACYSVAGNLQRQSSKPRFVHEHGRNNFTDIVHSSELYRMIRT